MPERLRSAGLNWNPCVCISPFGRRVSRRGCRPEDECLPLCPLARFKLCLKTCVIHSRLGAMLALYGLRPLHHSTLCLNVCGARHSTEARCGAQLRPRLEVELLPLALLLALTAWFASSYARLPRQRAGGRRKPAPISGTRRARRGRGEGARHRDQPHRPGKLMPRRGQRGGGRGGDRAAPHLGLIQLFSSASATASSPATRRARRELQSWECVGA